MAYEVFGPFDTVEAAVREVDKLGLKGNKAEDIIIYAHSSYEEQLKKRADAIVETEDNDSKSDNFFNKVKKAFNNDLRSDLSIHDQLLKLDFNESQATLYDEAIKQGHIIIVASEDQRMGNDAMMVNDPVPDTVKLKEDAIKRD